MSRGVISRTAASALRGDLVSPSLNLLDKTTKPKNLSAKESKELAKLLFSSDPTTQRLVLEIMEGASQLPGLFTAPRGLTSGLISGGVMGPSNQLP